jgi:hypothetical protein
MNAPEVTTFGEYALDANGDVAYVLESGCIAGKVCSGHDESRLLLARPMLAKSNW